jgi:arsenical pump membrane protein
MLAAAEQAWAPFVLVAGLLLVGTVAGTDGLFEALGARLARAPLSPRALLLALLALVAAVTAVLNLDTSVVFLTPVLVHAARRRGLNERPFLYGSVFMANSASLLLPGSNLTNLLVLRREPASGAEFAAQMLPAWLAACAFTAAFVALAFRLEDGQRSDDEAPPLRFGLGAAAALAATTLVLVLPNAALPVLAVGLAATGIRRQRPRLDVRALGLLFALTLALGTLARSWHGPAKLLNPCGGWASAGIAALASVLVNNLPRACCSPPSRPRTRARSSSGSTSAPTSPSPARSLPSSGYKPPAWSASTHRPLLTPSSGSCSFRSRLPVGSLPSACSRRRGSEHSTDAFAD